MKFGLESEKMIYDVKTRKVSNTAQRVLQALEDYKVIYGEHDVGRVTGEFVHNMIEMASSPTEKVFEVARDYLFSYELVREVCERTGKKLLPIGSYPLSFEPTMVSKWEYYVKNAILTGDCEVGWNLEPKHALFPAANCAGVHIHAELETFPQFHAFSSELVDKHNLAVALIPLAAFSSSPYFDGVNDAKSMRAWRYFFGVYGKFPQWGRVPPIFESSTDLLRFYRDGWREWEGKGVELGFDPDELHKQTGKSGANWGMVRWNHKWNTIEMRCFDTDLVGMDLAKFTLASRALKRTDIHGEHLFTKILLGERAELSNRADKQDQMIRALMPEVLEVSGSEVAVLPTPLMHRLVQLAVLEGLSNDLVYEYCGKIIKFASKELDWREKWIANTLFEAYFRAESTADWILKLTHRKKTLRKEDCEMVMEELLKKEEEQFKKVSAGLPQEFQPPQGGEHFKVKSPPSPGSLAAGMKMASKESTLKAVSNPDLNKAGT